MEDGIVNILGVFGVSSSTTALALFIFNKIWDFRATKMNEKAKEREELIKKHAESLQEKNEELLKAQEQATRARIAARNLEMSQIKKDILDQNNSLTKHIAGHTTFEREMMKKIDNVYERLNPIGENVKYIQGMMEMLTNGKAHSSIRSA
jgi:hypothetical protein